MKRQLRGRRVLVTGASSGIGRCVAEQAALEGARVALVARSADKLQELAGSLTSRGAEAIPFVADLGLDQDRRRLIEEVVARFGGLDILINVAGLGSWGHFATGTEAILRQIMEVNFFAPVELLRLALPYLQKGTEPAVVNVSSMCGRRGMPAWAEYSASKHALVGFSEAMRAELSRLNIDVCLILPGLTRSEWSGHFLRKEGREPIDWDKGMEPAIVAASVLDALKKGRRETVVGSDARWMLLVNRFFPRLVDALIARRIRKLYEASREVPPSTLPAT